MKKIVLLLSIFLVYIFPLAGQEPDTLIEEKVDTKDLVKVVETDNTTIVQIGDDEVMVIEKKEDGITITIGDEDIFTVVENEKGVTIKIGEDEIEKTIKNSRKEDTTIDDEEIETIIEDIGDAIEEVLKELNQEIEIEIDDEEFTFNTDKKDILEVLENDEETSIWIGDQEFLTVSEDKDTTKIRFGNKGIKIIEDDEGNTSVKVEKIDVKKKKKFKGHYMGLDIGFNNFMNDDFSMARTPENEFMDINMSRSETFGINFLQYSFGIGKSRKLGIVTGMGIQFADYFFNGNNSLQIDSLGNVTELLYDFDLTKSKLSTTYLEVPLLFEVQFPDIKRSKRVHLAAGVVGSMRLGSHTKVVYRDDGNKQKDKEKSDFNLCPLRYGITTRLGYKALNIFATYYPVSFFEKNKGPELYPFTVGLTFSP